MQEEIFYKELVDRYKAKKASDEELIVFFHLLREGRLDQYLNDSFREGVKDMEEAAYEIPRIRRASIWPRVAVAASVLAVISLVVYVLMFKSESIPDDSRFANRNTSGQNAIAYKTITTQRGQQSEMVLPDGTRVWVNAASSLRFPATFSGKERTVELDGECYFEVSKNALMPFKVKTTTGVEIRVLGTHFNVHAYRDEPFTATLLEGSIELRSAHDSAILKPGQKASIQESGKLSIVNTDVEEALAWKNGFFYFNKADMLTVMRQVEKWYDVEVVFEGQIPDKQFVGKVSRNSDITEVLEILRLSKVNFRMEGKKITVMP